MLLHESLDFVANLSPHEADAAGLEAYIIHDDIRSISI